MNAEKFNKEHRVVADSRLWSDGGHSGMKARVTSSGWVSVYQR